MKRIGEMTLQEFIENYNGLPITEEEMAAAVVYKLSSEEGKAKNQQLLESASGYLEKLREFREAMSEAKVGLG